MKLTAIIVYFDSGRPVEQVHLHAEFDAEHELPGAESDSTAAVVGRSLEVRCMAEALLTAIRSDFTGDDADIPKS